MNKAPDVGYDQGQIFALETQHTSTDPTLSEPRLRIVEDSGFVYPEIEPDPQPATTPLENIEFASGTNDNLILLTEFVLDNLSRARSNAAFMVHVTDYYPGNRQMPPGTRARVEKYMRDIGEDPLDRDPVRKQAVLEDMKKAQANQYGQAKHHWEAHGMRLEKAALIAIGADPEAKPKDFAGFIDYFYLDSAASDKKAAAKETARRRDAVRRQAKILK